MPRTYTSDHRPPLGLDCTRDTLAHTGTPEASSGTLRLGGPSLGLGKQQPCPWPSGPSPGALALAAFT